MATQPDTGFPVRQALFAVSAAWLLLRVAAPVLPLPADAARAVDSIHVYASPESGRLAIHGWPDAVEEFGVPDIADARAAFVRLDRRVDAANAALSRTAADAAARIVTLPDSTTALRVAGMLVVFAPPEAATLAALADPEPGRPCETIERLAQLVEIRLEEPPDALQIEGSAQHRELLRVSRDLRDDLEEQQREGDAAAEAFRTETRAAVHAAGGPFLRRDRGIAVESILAAWLGALLREALRRRRRDGARRISDPALSFAVAPALALAAIYALAGTRVLPLHPLLGLSPIFVAVAFVLGWSTPGWLRALSRLDRDDDDVVVTAAAPPAADHAASPARPVGTFAPPYRPPLPPPAAERPPFYPKRRGPA